MADVVVDGERGAEVVALTDLPDDTVELLAEGGDPDALAEAFRRRLQSGEVRPDASSTEA